MAPWRLWRTLPFPLRLSLSGVFAGCLGGVAVVCLVVALDIARLHTLLATAAMPPSPAEWLTVPCVFAALGLTVAWTMTLGD